MQKYHSIQRHEFILIVPLFIIAAVLFAGCGASGSSTGSGSASNPTPAPTTVKGYGTAYGCPSDAVVAPPAGQPDVIIKITDSNTTINAHTGDVIEVHLPFGQQWSGPTTTSSILQLQTPSGYALKSAKVCVWRFTAQSSGTAHLAFAAKAMCKAGELCPQYILSVPFTIVVK
ncbi:MAG TPA: hypothetical protein VKR42_04445 [Ktedonobacteraceae bacterium]|nr:hypothetical protein [Ktedonobacteraceae bacterium]